MRPVLVTGVQRLLDQQSAKTRAVDEQVGFDARAVVEHQGLDEPVRGAQAGLDNLAFGALDAARFGVAAQIAGVQTGIEVISVGDFGERRIARRIQRRNHELAGGRRDGIQRIGADVFGLAGPERLTPVLVERQGTEVAPDRSEPVNVGVADFAPIDELDPELERALHLAHEFRLVDLEQLVERAQVRHRRLADADDADLLGFNQMDRQPAAERLGQRRRGHPACRATTNDGDSLNAVRSSFGA